MKIRHGRDSMVQNKVPLSVLLVPFVDLVHECSGMARSAYLVVTGYLNLKSTFNIR